MSGADRMPHLRWAEIDAAAIEHNAATVASWIPGRCRLMAMVKSDGYGHGAVTAARHALRGGATWLGVYTPEEALELRRAGIGAPVLVAGYSPHAALAELVDANVDVTVFDIESVHACAAAARRRAARCHIKVDTGLGRLGVAPEGLPALLGAVRQAGDRAVVSGVFTHFADTAAASEYTTRQNALLRECADLVHERFPDAMVHAAGTAAIIERPDTHHDMVRAGIALYGYTPPGVMPPAPLLPVMTVLAQVVQVKWVAAGSSVGYGRTWQAKERRRIATVAMGYAQGVPRALSNRGVMTIRGVRCPIVGTVSMDQVTVDVSDVAEVTQGEVAMFFGRWGDVGVGADEVADMLQTVSYEVLCRSGRVVARRVRGEVDAQESPGRAAVP